MEDAAFPLIGEPLAIDLVNTRPNSQHGRVDLLGTADGLRSWLALQADRLGSAGEGPVTAADLAAVHAVRDHTERAIQCVRQGLRPPAAALKALNQAQRAAPAFGELAWTGSAVATTTRRDGPFGIRLAAHLAEAAGTLLSDPAITSVRDCEADDCALLFLPAHPRRRWCSASLCGNRARVARYYQRHKSS